MATPASSRYLDYLPAIFQQRTAAGQEPYLGHFLLPFEHAFQTFEAVLFDLERYFTPALTAAEDFLPWLANWLALLVDEEWDEDQRRRLLSEAVALYRWRGTKHGLQRYLEIYTGLKPEMIVIREACWPQGMQIGVASRIGGGKPSAQPFSSLVTAINLTPLAQRDYYVVDTSHTGALNGATAPMSPAPTTLIYCPTDCVQQVMVNDDTVKVVIDKQTVAAYHPATVRRRNALADNHYELTLAEKGEPLLTYQGDPLLDEAANVPYRFVVEIQGASAQPVRIWLTEWLTALLHNQADSRQVLLGESRLARVLRHPLTAAAHTKLLDLYMNLLDAKKIGKDQTPEAFYLPLTAILCEPLTEIERFVVNWQAPTDETVRIQLTSAHTLLTEWTHSKPLPGCLHCLAAELSALTCACLTNDARQQVRTLAAQMLLLADQLSRQTTSIPPDDETLVSLQLLLKSATALLAQPLTIQEALARKQQQGQRKLHTILALEKPAHTAYALKAIPVVYKAQPQPMVIGVHAYIGLNTTVG